jgi:hypothetical protein
VVVDAGKKESGRERKRKTLLGERKKCVLKKSLTGPTLLEMSGYRVNQALLPFHFVRPMP